MKILRVVGLCLAILLIKFVLMRGVFNAFEGMLVNVFNAVGNIAGNIPQGGGPASPINMGEF